MIQPFFLIFRFYSLFFAWHPRSPFFAFWTKAFIGWCLIALLSNDSPLSMHFEQRLSSNDVNILFHRFLEFLPWHSSIAFTFFFVSRSLLCKLTSCLFYFWRFHSSPIFFIFFLLPLSSYFLLSGTFLKIKFVIDIESIFFPIVSFYIIQNKFPSSISQMCLASRRKRTAWQEVRASDFLALSLHVSPIPHAVEQDQTQIVVASCPAALFCWWMARRS